MVACLLAQQPGLMHYRNYPAALTDGLRFCTTAQMARMKTMAPMIQALHASALVADAYRRTQGEMNTQAPNTMLIQLTAAGAVVASAHIATRTINTPKIQAFQELVAFPHVTEYHGEMKRIMPRIRFTQLCHRALACVIIISSLLTLALCYYGERRYDVAFENILD
jgi:hypothetical protein